MTKTNKILVFVTIILISKISIAQDLLEVVIENEIPIIQTELYNVEDDLAEEYLLFKHKKVLKQIEANRINLNEVQELLRRKPESKVSWNKKDFSKALLLGKNERIDLSKLDKILERYDEDQRQKILDDVNSYNKDLESWRKIPIAISRPIYNEEQDLAIVGYIYGNENGKISLFRKKQNVWELVVDISNWIN